MAKLFSNVLNAAPNSRVDSAAVTVTSDDDVVVSIASKTPSDSPATLLVNGQDVGTSASVSEGDTVQVRTTSSAAYVGARHIAINFGSVLATWVVVTQADPAIYPNPQFLDKDPFEFDHDADGVEYRPNASLNKMLVRDDLLQGPATKNVSLQQAVKDENAQDTANVTLPVCLFYENRVDIFDTVAKIVVRSYQTSGQPYKAIRVPHNPGSSVMDTWITIADKDQVEVRSSTHQLLQTIPVGERPMGIAVSADGMHVWIANSGDNTLTHLQWNGSSWARTNVQVGDHPLEISVDAAGIAWVTCARMDRVYRVTAADLVSFVTVGMNPRGIVCNTGGVWVAVSSEAKVVRIDETGVLNTLNVGLVPVSITSAGSGNIVVGCFGTQQLYELNAQGVLAVCATDKFPFRMFSVNGEIFEASLWSGTPEYVYQHDQTPFQFFLDGPESLSRGRTFRTNEFSVQGINVSTPISISPVYGATINKNAQSIGTSGTVVQGDEVSISFTAPSEAAVSAQIELAIGGQVGLFASTTSVIDDIVDAFDMTTISNASTSTDYTSNEITVSGLETGVSVLASITNGTLILNGVDQESISAQVQNGDKIKVRMKSSAQTSTPVFSTIRIGSVEDVWTVFTQEPAGSTYYQPITDAGKTIFDFMAFDTSFVNKSDQTQNAMYVYDSTTMDTPIKYALSGTGAQNGNASATYLYALDPSTKRAWQMDTDDTSTPGVERVYALNGMPYGLAAGPQVASGQISTKHYIGLYDKNQIVKLGTAVVLNLQAGTKPLGIAVNNYNEMYVAGDNGFLSVLDYDETAAEFVYSTLIGIPDAGRLCDIVIDDTTMFVTDLTKGAVHKLTAGNYVETILVGHLPFAIAMSTGYIFTANFGSASVSMFPKSGGANNVKTVQLPSGASQPTGIAVDNTRNKVFVSCPRSRMIYELDATTLAITRSISTASAGYPWGLQMVGTKLMVVSMWGDMLTKLNIGQLRTGPTSLSFTPSTGADLDSTVTSNASNILQIIPLPEQVWIEPFSDVALYKNGVNVGYTTTVKQLDKLSIQSKVPQTYLGKRVVSLFSYRMSRDFSITATADVFPDKMMFTTVQNVIPKDYVSSDTQTVSGLGNGVTVNVLPVPSIVSDGQAIEVWVNDVQIADPTVAFPVTNGDTIRVDLYAYGLPWNGNLLQVFLVTDRGYRFAVFNIYSGYLDNAIRPPSHGMSNYPGMGVTEATTPKNAHQIERVLDAVYQRLTAFETLNSLGAEKITFENAYSEVENGASFTHLFAPAMRAEDMSFEQSQFKARVVDALQSSVGLRSYSLHSVNQDTSAVEVNRSWVYATTAADIGVRATHFPAVVNTSAAWSTATFSRTHIGDAEFIDLFPIKSSWQERATHLVDTAWKRAIENQIEVPMPTSVKTQANGRSSKTAMQATLVAASPKIITSMQQYLDGTSDPWVLKDMTFNADVVRGSHSVTSKYSSRRSIKHSQLSMWFSLSSVDRRTRPKISAVYARTRHGGVYKSASLYALGARWKRLKISSTYDRLRPRKRVRTQANIWLRFVARKKVFTAAVYERRRLRRYQANTPLPTWNRLTKRGRKIEDNVAQFVRPKRMVFDAYQYNAGMIRAFDTPEQAIAEGQRLQHPVVYAKELVDGNFFWYVPGQIERADCVSTPGKITVVKGYVQGG